MPIDIVANVEKAIELFAGIASDPISAVLLALGGLFVAVSVAVLGGLAVGGAVGAIGRFAESSGQRG